MSDTSTRDNYLNDFFGEVISTYTRAQAIDDGILFDVSELAREAGFRVPVAVTAEVWYRYIEWTAEDSRNQTTQDTTGRLWDVLSMLLLAIRSQKSANTRTDTVFYQLRVVPRDGKTKRGKLTELKAVMSGGDHREPVMTILLPDED